MLSPADIASIKDRFYVYEHEWRYLTCYLGEPSKAGGCVIYDDGKVLSICAFPITIEKCELSIGDLDKIIGRMLRPNDHQIVHVWGAFDLLDEIRAGGQIFTLVHPESKNEVFAGEYTIDLEAHELANLPEARKAVRRILNKGLLVSVNLASPLSAKHMELVEYWAFTRPISTMAAVAGHSIFSFVSRGESDVFIAEVKLDGQIRGFSVFSFPNDAAAVNIMSFSEKYPGSRLEDALIWGTIDFSRARGKKTLHLGYAGSENLVKFKKKWGAAKSGIDYKQAIYARDEVWKQHAASYDFFWTSRVVKRATA